MEIILFYILTVGFLKFICGAERSCEVAYKLLQKNIDEVITVKRETEKLITNEISNVKIELNSKFTEVQTTNSKLNTDLTFVGIKMNSLDLLVNNKIFDYDLVNKNTQGKFDDLKENLISMKSEILAIKSKLDSNQINTSREIISLKSEISSLKSQNTDYKNRIVTLETDNTDNKHFINR